MTSTRDNTTTDKRRWLVFVCLLAAVTHGLFYFYRPEPSLGPDEKEYIALGVGLAETGELRLPTGEVAKRMPLYPAFVAAIYRWQGPDLCRNSVLVIQTLLAWCSTIVIALTAERLADGRAGWMAGTVAALYSPYRFLQMSFLTEGLVIFFVLLALYLYIAVGLQSRSTPARWAGLFGTSMLIGLSILTRANAMLFIVPFAIDAAWRTGRVMERAARVVLILVPAVACACWWGARNNRLLDTFTLSTSGGLNFYLGHNARYADQPGIGGDTDYQAFNHLRREAGLTEVEADRRLYRDGCAFVAANRWQTVVNSFRKLGVWLRPSVPQHGPLTLVLGLGAVMLCEWRRRRQAPRLAATQRGARRRPADSSRPVSRRNNMIDCVTQLARRLFRLADQHRPAAQTPRTATASPSWLCRLADRPFTLFLPDSLFYSVTSLALIASTAWWAYALVENKLPLTTPLFVVPLGLIALICLRSRPNVRGLLLGLFATQLAVAVVFIPLTRLRWVVDGLLIIAIGIGLSQVCGRLRQRVHIAQTGGNR